MRKGTLAAVAFGFLALAACGRGDQDKLNDADLNAENQSLDELSNDAANLASESQVLENQAEQIEQEAQATDDAAGAETPADENISGM